MKLLNKELLSEILDIDTPNNIELTYGSEYENNIKQSLLLSYSDGSEPIIINIYELAHKCKKWANKQGYAILSTVHIEADKTHFGEFGVLDSKTLKYVIKGLADTEVEAIFKACEWILEQEAKDNERDNEMQRVK